MRRRKKKSERMERKRDDLSKNCDSNKAVIKVGGGAGARAERDIVFHSELGRVGQGNARQTGQEQQDKRTRTHIQ